MQSEGIAPDTASYNSALNGLAKRREWYRARRLFRQMVSSGLSPDGHSYNGLVEAAGMGSISPRQNMIQASFFVLSFARNVGGITEEELGSVATLAGVFSRISVRNKTLASLST